MSFMKCDGHSQHKEAVRRKNTAASPGNGRPVTAVLAVLLLGFLSGCGASRPSKYYQLTVPGDGAPAAVADPFPATILVGALQTSDLYRDDRIVYSSGAQPMGTYEYERWAEPPAEMIQEVLLRELRASGRYHAVYSRRSNANGDFVLRGRLYDFKEVDGGSLVARVTMDLEMRDLKSSTTVWTHYYTHDEPVSEKNVPAVAAALDKNVQRAASEVLASLDQYFAAHPAK